MIYDVKSPQFRRFLAKGGVGIGSSLASIGKPLQIITETLSGTRTSTGTSGGFHSA